jgi:hypothetical protein
LMDFNLQLNKGMNRAQLTYARVIGSEKPGFSKRDADYSTYPPRFRCKIPLQSNRMHSSRHIA